MINMKNSVTTELAGREVVCKSNHLIQQSKINLTVTENRIINYLISKIKPTDTEIKPVSLDYKEFCDIAQFKSYENFTYIKRCIKTLRDKSIEIIENNEYVPLKWLDDYYINTNSVILTLSKRMEKYLLQLIHSGGYTQSRLQTYFSFNCKYSFVLYDLLKSYVWINKGKVGYLELTYAIEELKEKLGIEKEQYVVFQNFRRKVIDKAVAEINKTDIFATYEPIRRTGRSYTHIKFKIKERKSDEGYNESTKKKKKKKQN